MISLQIKDTTFLVLLVATFCFLIFRAILWSFIYSIEDPNSVIEIEETSRSEQILDEGEEEEIKKTPKVISELESKDVFKDNKDNEDNDGEMNEEEKDYDEDKFVAAENSQHSLNHRLLFSPISDTNHLECDSTTTTTSSSSKLNSNSLNSLTSSRCGITTNSNCSSNYRRQGQRGVNSQINDEFSKLNIKTNREVLLQEWNNEATRGEMDDELLAKIKLLPEQNQEKNGYGKTFYYFSKIINDLRHNIMLKDIYLKLALNAVKKNLQSIEKLKEERGKNPKEKYLEIEAQTKKLDDDMEETIGITKQILIALFKKALELKENRENLRNVDNFERKESKRNNSRESSDWELIKDNEEEEEQQVVGICEEDEDEENESGFYDNWEGDRSGGEIYVENSHCKER